MVDRGDLTTDRLRAVLQGNCTRSRRKIPGQAGTDGGVIAGNDGGIVWNDGMLPKLPSGEHKIKPLPKSGSGQCLISV